MLLDYVLNLSIFSLMVNTPLVIRSFMKPNPIKHFRLFAGLYAGIVSSILVRLSINEQGYLYDIRYAVLILVFAYLGPLPGLLAGGIALSARLLESPHWFPAVGGWFVIISAFTLIHRKYNHVRPALMCVILYGSYSVIYSVMIPFVFGVFRNDPLFHIQYLVFIFFGVLLGALLIESYEKLHRTISEKNAMKESLTESEGKYRLIAENTSDLIAVMGKDRFFNYISPSHGTALGYSSREIDEMGILSTIHPDDFDPCRRAIEEVFHKKETISVELRLHHKDGRWIEFESRCMPVLESNGSLEHIVIVSRDISERKKAEEILLRTEKLSVVGELAAGVAHEIRNPLTTIKGFVQLYKAENPEFKFNDLILGELNRIETITSEMLSLGKPQAITLEQANITDIIENTIDILSPEAHLKGVQFTFLYEEPEYMIKCEKNQIKQVFLNIFKNAMEAMGDGGEIQIALKRSPAGECIITVQDQGCGIPEDILPRLGEPFYTLKEKGTGLGLMICHKIIKQHHGSIVYQSRLNEGTLITITIPLAG
ncbi:PAS domain-containing sensor histidine kinase [Neobacillus piezotolerans]|uniref:histidine kinase n=1 Tax=Neobacillus piezotolerans TaxID=2259171 RepID=A0A3D8GUY9_9BACI|nr:ATP-binding protein [Neobacillus piezotolerans]RDU38280.1 PAS domain-containing sensor histidine kinase [Neobacillus piezotolerans]